MSTTSDIGEADNSAAREAVARAARREHALYGAALVVFAACAAVTLWQSRAMAMSMSMPGGWSMSMTWMGMGAWWRGALLFCGMWAAMMVTMMLPSTLPMLVLYRRVASFQGERHLDLLSWTLAAAYFFVWLLFGLAAYAIGLLIAHGAMHSAAVARAVPVGAGVALLAAGIYQLTPWKSACLQHCRDPLTLLAGHLGGGWRGALRLGLHHGAFCAACCWALMLIQLVLGVMSLAVMAAVAVVIAAEKLLPRGLLVARVVGVLALVAGAVMLARALG